MTREPDLRPLESVVAEASMISWDLLMDFIDKQSNQQLSDHKQVYGMRLAGEEILSNMMRENQVKQLGIPESNSEPINIWISSQIALRQSIQWFEILIEDNGPHFDPNLNEPRTINVDGPFSERPIGGLGLFLVQQSVDEATYQRVNHRNRYKLGIKIKPH